MVSSMEFLVCFLGIVGRCMLSVHGRQHDEEPTCLSRFDFDYKVLSHLVTLDTERNKQEELIQEHASKIDQLEQKIKGKLVVQMYALLLKLFFNIKVVCYDIPE